MAHDDHVALTQLVFLRRGPMVMHVVIVVLLAVGVGVGGALLAGAHVALQNPSVDVHSLNPLQRLLRSGSSAVTMWPGWAAAALFALALLRLRRGPIEPAAGRAPLEQLSAAELRRGLRREYTAVRVLLCVVLLVAAVDVSRTMATIVDSATSSAAASQVSATTVEAIGYVVAGGVLTVWARSFALQLVRLGAT